MRRFSAFFRENYAPVVRVAERRLRSQQDAEDIAVRAFQLAWQHYQAGHPLSPPWLYRALRNLIGDEYRRRHRRTELQRTLHEKLLVDAVIPDDFSADLRDAVERLPQIHRDVLLMSYWDELTATEIAVILHTNSTAVRARLVRARRRLRNDLGLPQEDSSGEAFTQG